MKRKNKNLFMILLIPTIVWLVLLFIIHFSSSDDMISIWGVNESPTHIPLWIIHIVILFGYIGSIVIGLVVLYEKMVWKEI